MTDEQFERLLQTIQAQTRALEAQAEALAKIATAVASTETIHTELATEIKQLRNVNVLGTALSLCRSRSTENKPLQENGGLAGAIADICKFVDTGKTPENWKDYITNEIYVKTFSGKPLKMEEI